MPRRVPRAGWCSSPPASWQLQVERALATYGSPLRVRVTAIYGGVPMGPQKKALQQGTDIVVATPGRLLDHMKQRTIDLSAIEILTLDEADRMLDMGFLPPLRKVIPALPRTRQTLMFSATFSKEVITLAGEFTRDAARVDVSDGQVVAPTVTHRMHPVSQERKRDLLVHVLTQAPVGQALVFCKTKRGSDRVGDGLEQAGIKVAVIHGNKSQGARKRALLDFKTGRVTTLVATDIAARGLDIVQLPLVVNYDLPLVADDYIHRVGRTGRAGHAGRAVSLVTAADRSLLADIQRRLPGPIEQVAVDGFAAGAAPGAGTGAAPRHRQQRQAPRRGTFRPSRPAGRRFYPTGGLPEP